MTSTVTRTPLQALSMTSTQRPDKRRSARLAFGEEDAQSAKRPKVDGGTAGKAKQVNGRANGASNKKTKQSYEEEADGFQFSRTRSKKAQAKPPPSEPVVNGETSGSAAPTRKRKSSTTAAPDGHVAPKIRRSARLSGDKEQVRTDKEEEPQIENSKKRRENGVQKPLDDEDKEVDHVDPSELRVEKKRNPTKIPLPFADTPRIERNKEMRKTNTQSGSRRSSLGNRGRRASSLIDSGTSEGGLFASDLTQHQEADFSGEAMPHEEVETGEFYKHIAQDLTEPRRLKHLLMWGARRALPEKPFGEAKDAMAASAARAIQEELLKDFQNKSDMSDWFNREEAEPAVLVKKPNPRNIQNAAKLQELEQQLTRLKEEKRAWDDLLKTTPCLAPSLTRQQQSSSQPDPSAEAPNNPPPPVDLNLSSIDKTLLDPSQSSILASLSFLTQPQPSLSTTLPPPQAAQTQTRLRDITENIQFSIDSFADGIHKLEVFREQAERVADRILGVAAEKLEDRSRATGRGASAPSRSKPRERSRSRSRSMSGTDKDGGGKGKPRDRQVEADADRGVDIRNVLRGLSRVVDQ